MKRNFWSAVAVLVVTGILAAGSGAALAQDEITLTIWIMPNGPDPMGAITQEIEAFEADHPGVNVEAEVLDWGSAWTRITTAAVSGEGPDVSQLGTTWVAAIDAFGALRPFTEEEIAAMGGPSNFVPPSWATTIPVGKISPVAVPWFVDVRAMIYRADIFEELGIDPDEAFADWDSFDATLAQIMDAGLTTTTADGEEVPIYAFAFPGKNDWNVLHNFAPWVWGAGGDILNATYTEAVFNSPAAMEGVEFYTSLYTKGYTPPDALELNSAQIEGLYAEGRVAMVVSGPWIVLNSRTDPENGGFAGSPAAENLAVAQIPAGPAGRYTFVGGSDLTVWNSSEHQDLAVELVQYLVSAESQVRYCSNISMLPAVVEALEDPYFAEDPAYSVFIEAMDNGRSYPTIPAWGPIETVMVTNLGALWDDVAGVNGPFDPETMIPARLDAAVEEVNNVLAQQ